MFSTLSNHAVHRLTERFPFSDNMKENIKKRIATSLRLFNNGKSYAIQIMRFDKLFNEPGFDYSNGNSVVLILRPNKLRNVEAVTLMFRRTDDLGLISQPFTPQALNVDFVVKYEEFVVFL